VDVDHAYHLFEQLQGKHVGEQEKPYWLHGKIGFQLYGQSCRRIPLDLFFGFCDDRALDFDIFCALSFIRALRSYSPSNWLVKRLCFHEKQGCVCSPIMVALPTRVYIEGEFAAIESYGKFCRGCILLEGTKS